MESYTHLTGLEDQVKSYEDQVQSLEDEIKELNDKLSEADSEMINKENLVKQHAKVAEEAVSGFYLLLHKPLFHIYERVKSMKPPCLIKYAQNLVFHECIKPLVFDKSMHTLPTIHLCSKNTNGTALN